MNVRPIKCDDALDWIESVVRGELAESARERFDAHLAGCDGCREALDNAIWARDTLGATERPTCPDTVVDRIMAAVDAEEASARAAMAPPPRAETAHHPAPWSPAAWGRWIWQPRFALAAAAVVAVVIVAIRPPWGGDEVATDASEKSIDEMSPSELASATEEVKFALGIVARAMNHTARSVGSEVRDHLSTPVMRGVEQSVDHLPAPLDSEEKSQDGAALDDESEHDPGRT